MTSAMSLRGRVALVTGASRRIAIGAGVARRLVSDGAAVLLHSWTPPDAPSGTWTSSSPTTPAAAPRRWKS
ncbi:MAG: hypothetical protein ACRDTA_03145 [Pseudonocardiaceae bacterium]